MNRTHSEALFQFSQYKRRSSAQINKQQRDRK